MECIRRRLHDGADNLRSRRGRTVWHSRDLSMTTAVALRALVQWSRALLNGCTYAARAQPSLVITQGMQVEEKYAERESSSCARRNSRSPVRNMFLFKRNRRNDVSGVPHSHPCILCTRPQQQPESREQLANVHRVANDWCVLRTALLSEQVPLGGTSAM